MKKLQLFSLLLILSLSLSAQDVFEKPFMLNEKNGEIINTGGWTYAAPYFGDFDGDGDDDLLLGYWEKYIKEKGAKMFIYENIGTNEKPSYADRKLFKINDKIVELYGY